MSNPLRGKRLVLGVSGSIAAYKAADLASRLTQEGVLVDTIMTAAAQRFVSPLSFQSVTGRRAYTDEDLWGGEGHVLHVGLAHQADLLVVAPATADTLAKLAHGRAEDLLSVTALASECPLIVAPAMDGGMFAHPATQANLEVLQARGARVVGPAEGHLASGLVGPGRLVEPRELVGHIRLVLGQNGPLSGRRVVVTAGGTQEPLDPVRTLTNRSSGRQGYALAQATLDLGAETTLISAARHLPVPVGARLVPVDTAQEMLAAVLKEVEQAHLLLMAAAVADFRPASMETEKIKKAGGVPDLVLEPTPDILGAVVQQRARSGYPHVVVGFAAESQDLLENARAKLESKGLDLIVANDIRATDAGFEVATNRVTLLSASGEVDALPLMTKSEVAEEIMTWVLPLLEKAGQ